MNDKTSNISKIVAFSISILTLFGLITTQGDKVFKLLDPRTPEFWTVLLCLLNLIVLILFFVIFTKEHTVVFKEASIEGENKYSSLLHVMSDGNEEGVNKAHWYNERINKIVKQLKTNIVWYGIFLIPVYSLFIFDTEKHPHRLHAYFKIAEDIFNYMSSLFIYFAFLVLYNKTLDKKNEPCYLNNSYFIAAILFSIGYGVMYAIYGMPSLGTTPVIGSEISKPDIISNRFSLVAGMINGLVMMQLFARYISMEHWAQQEKKIKYPSVITIGVIYLLPIYAIVQPLFGSFHITAVGRAEVFANCVFAVCLCGKSFFLYVTWLFIKKKIPHLYLHNVITPHDVQQGYADCFKLD